MQKAADGHARLLALATAWLYVDGQDAPACDHPEARGAWRAAPDSVYTLAMPQTKVAYFTKLDPKLRAAMRRYKEAVGVPEAQQVDRALREWLGERPEAWPLSSAKATSKRERGERPRIRRSRSSR